MASKVLDTDRVLGVCRISPAGMTRVLAGTRAGGERIATDYRDAILAYGVDPLFLLAIFSVESYFGKNGWANKTKSWGNTRPPSYGASSIGVYNQDTKAFSTLPVGGGRFLSAYKNYLEGCISTAARLVEHPAYRGKATVRQIIQTWAPPTDGNDTEAYITKVIRFMRQNQDMEEPIVKTPTIADKLVAANHWQGRRGNQVQAVVIHVAEGSKEAVANWFANPAAEASAHYLVCKDGTPWQFVREADAAWANGKLNRPNLADPLITAWQQHGINPNDTTISIETERHWQEPLTAPQLASLTWLCADIHRRHNLPTDGSRLLGHNEFDSVDRANCPHLSAAEWAALVKGLGVVALSGIPTGTISEAVKASLGTMQSPIVIPQTTWEGRGRVVSLELTVCNDDTGAYYAQKVDEQLQPDAKNWREA